MLHLLTGLFERIPTFMSTYVQRLMNILLQFSGAKDQLVDLLDARNVLMQTITEDSSTETCVESLSACWTKVEHSRKVCRTLTSLTLDSGDVHCGTRLDHCCGNTGKSHWLFEIVIRHIPQDIRYSKQSIFETQGLSQVIHH